VYRRLHPDSLLTVSGRVVQTEGARPLQRPTISGLMFESSSACAAASRLLIPRFMLGLRQLSLAGMFLLLAGPHAVAGEPVLSANSIDEMLAAHRQNPARFISQYASGRKLRAVGEVREIVSVSRLIYRVSFRTGRNWVACTVNQSLAASVVPNEMVDFEGFIEDVTQGTLLLTRCRFVAVPNQAAEREQAAAAERQLKVQESLEREKQKHALERRRQEQLRQIREQARGARSPEGPASGPGTYMPTPSYADKIVEQLRSNIPLIPTNGDRRSVTVHLRVDASGMILSFSVVTSSGHPVWDEIVLRAFAKMGSLPRDIDGRIPKVLVQNGLEITVTE